MTDSNPSRRQVLRWTAAGMAVAVLPQARGQSSGRDAAPQRVAAGAPQAFTPGQAFEPLPLGAIRPRGWLLRQLRIQADGMTGHLHDFWPDVDANSGWLGGSGERWERGPYYIDGLLPLAVLLDDDRLKRVATQFVEWTLTHQRADGMIGPAGDDDWWPRMVMVKVLAQHYEATGDERAPAVLTRYFHYQLSALPVRPLRDWGKFRWQDQVYIVQWLHARTGDPKLLELAALLRQQGFDWVGSFADFQFKEKVDKSKLLNGPGGGNNAQGYQSHGVNNGQALKTAAVQARSGNVAENRAGFYRQLAALDRYHGMPTGMFSCDEHLAGLNPSQGTELCTVVETMFSLEIALAVFGDVGIADRIESIAYNALPATLTADMWAHQYDQQVNQVQCSLNTKPWTTNGPESNLFGLEPNFGCCTANYHQGWPKLVASLWMRTPDDGLAAVLYGPSEVGTSVRGVVVRLRQDTEYPFRDTVTIAVDPAATVRFPLRVRIPEWSSGATILVNGTEHGQRLVAGTFAVLDREWKFGDRVDIQFRTQVRVSRWFNGSVAVQRGALLFAWSAGEHWVKLRDRGLTADWQVFPGRAWNHALAVNEDTAASLPVHLDAVGAVPFSAESRPVSIDVPARLLDSWRAEDGVAPPPPAASASPRATALQTLTLVPYGTARLRITAFPTTNA